MAPFTRESRRQALDAELSRRILILDGAMATEIQALRLDEAVHRKRSINRAIP